MTMVHSLAGRRQRYDRILGAIIGLKACISTRFSQFAALPEVPSWKPAAATAGRHGTRRQNGNNKFF